MKQMLSLLLMFSLLMAFALAEESADGPECWVNKEVEDPYLGKTLDELTALYGAPDDPGARVLPSWHIPGAELGTTNVLICGMMTDDPYEDRKVTDYLLLDENRRVISGTIPEDSTLATLRDTLRREDVYGFPHIYYFGSGVAQPTSITADGYIVSWHPVDGSWYIYDCVTQREAGFFLMLRMMLGWV